MPPSVVQQWREALGLPPMVTDEWLAEYIAHPDTGGNSGALACMMESGVCHHLCITFDSIYDLATSPADTADGCMASILVHSVHF